MSILCNDQNKLIDKLCINTDNIIYEYNKNNNNEDKYNNKLKKRY